jgi:putative ABC transport system permease protein
MATLLADELHASGTPSARARVFVAAMGDVVRTAVAERRQPSNTFGSSSSMPALPPGSDAPRPRGRDLLSNFLQDFRHGVRLLRRYPAMAAIATATLALGIGANTAIFSVVDAVLVRALPYPHPEALVTVFESRVTEGVQRNAVTPADFVDWRADNQSFSAMAAFAETTASLSGAGEPAQILVGLGSPGFFDVLGVQPEIGRGFLPEEEQRGKHRVAVLTHGFWTRQFGADPGVIGQTVIITGNAWRIIGVLPDTFQFLDHDIALFGPLALTTPLSRGGHSLEVYGRLKAGVSLDAARSDMDRIARRLQNDFPEDNRGHGVFVEPMQTTFVQPVRTRLIVLLVGVGFVLLIACANVASLLLVRSAARAREMAVRAAIGASRHRLVRQGLAECLVLASAGGVLGLGLAHLLIRALPAVLPAQLSIVRTAALGLDLRVLAAAAAITMLTTLLFGALPALLSSRTNVVGTLNQGGRGATGIARPVRLALVIGEVALASLTLVGAGLVVRSFAETSSQPLGFDPHERAVMELAAPEARYTTEASRTAAMQELERRLAAIPGVRSVGAIDLLPLSGEDARLTVAIDGHAPVADAPTRMHPRAVTPTYFQAAAVGLVRGRRFTDADRVGTPLVAIVNETAAARFWPGEDVIGRRFNFGRDDEPWITIVGVARDVRHWGFSKDINPMVYLPEAQEVWSSGVMQFVIDTPLSVETLRPFAAAAVHGFDPNMPLGNLRPFDGLVANALRADRAQTLLMTAFGVLALLLAAVGIYGVMSQLVNSRVQEIGVRLALGARPAHILTQFLAGCVWQVAVGIVAGGLAGVYLMTRAGILVRISAWDPIALSLAAAVIFTAAMLACLVPASRAMRVDPVTAMRP